MKLIKNNTYRRKTYFFLVVFLLTTFSVSAQTAPKLILPIGHTSNVESANFSPDGKRIVTAAMDKTVKMWDAQTGAFLVDLT